MPGKTREEVDIGRITQWIRDPFRKPAQTAFTEGPERQIAYAVGDVLLPLLEKAVMAIQAQKLYDLGQEYKAEADSLRNELIMERNSHETTEMVLVRTRDAHFAWKADADRLAEALKRIKERTILDADGPELRCQNENNYKDAVEALAAHEALKGKT